MSRLRAITVLASDLEPALASWHRASGLSGESRRTAEGQAATLKVGDIDLELLSPVRGGPFAVPTIVEGDALYALRIETEDFESLLARMRDAGVLLSDIVVVDDGSRAVKIDPASTHGVPIMVVEARSGP